MLLFIDQFNGIILTSHRNGMKWYEMVFNVIQYEY